MRPAQSLAQFRIGVLNLRRETVARATDIEVDRLAALEDDEAEPLSVFEAEALAELYGVEAGHVLDRKIRLGPGNALAVLPSLDEYTQLDDARRLQVLRSANAARDLIKLRKLLAEDDARARFLRERPRLEPPKRSVSPHEQGKHYASALRRAWGLGSKPIPSMRDLLATRLPSLNVLYGKLGPTGPAGVSFVDAVHGPSIVLNMEGKNVNPTVRRFSLAHELFHVLVDWQGRQPLAVLSGFLSEAQLEQERKANSFAVRFLCPPAVVRRVREDEPGLAAEKLSEFGIPYAAIRLYLRNELGGELLPVKPDDRLMTVGTDKKWADAEAPPAEAFPVTGVPLERRTGVALAAAKAYSAHKIPRDAFAAYLGVPPTERLETVLDFFVLPTVHDGAALDA